MMRGAAKSMPAVSFVAPAPFKAPVAAPLIIADQAPDAGAVGASFPQGVVMAGLVACGASAAALGRRGARRHRPALQAYPSNCPKALEGTGGPNPSDFWDPAGLAKGKSEEQLLHWRAVELKHGRVAMLACLGWIHVAAGWHPIGDGAARVRVSDDPLINVTQLPLGGAFQLIFTILCLEWLTTYVCKPPKSRPWDILGWKDVIADEEFPDWKENQLKELNNGRLAMFGILGLIGQDALTGDYVTGLGKPADFWYDEWTWSVMNITHRYWEPPAI